MSQESEILEFELCNQTGLTVGLTNHGASIQSLRVPTKDGDVNVVLGYSSAEDYVTDPYYVGATVGRYAGRIANGKFRLGNRTIQLEPCAETGAHVLHGGPGGLHSRLWSAESLREQNCVRFHHESSDGEQGFPGSLSVTVTYSLLDDLQLTIDFTAICDKETVVNLANHAYFNLNGPGSSIENHIVTIHADEYTVQDEELIPVGEINSVANTLLDLRMPSKIGERLADLNSSNTGRQGFDQNYVLRKINGGLEHAATVVSPVTGIELRVLTTQPGLQFYTGDNLDQPFAPRDGLCLEAQNFPDAPNHSNFPSAVLLPGYKYQQRTVYAFGLAS